MPRLAVRCRRQRARGAGQPAARAKGPAGIVAVVLSGGGARGAYEAGALSVLLPALEARGERPRILLGTSAGALNVSFLAAHADLPAGELITEALDIWGSISWGEVARPIVSLASLRRVAGYAGEVLGLPRAEIDSLLDPAPLRRTLRERIDFDRLAANVAAGHLDTVGVAATAAVSGRSVVFHTGLPSPPPDDRRRIDYAATPLREEHVLASSAIPAVFPAVRVAHPAARAGWYVDGGTRLNTPVKPALAFGAERVVVVGVSPLTAPPAPPPDPAARRPDALVGAGQILTGLLEDQLVADVQTLATINAVVGEETERGGRRRVPYIAIAPASPDPIAERALAVVREQYGSPAGAARSPDLALLARLTAAGEDAAHAALLSFLLFAPEFGRALIELGREDATRWLESPHDLDEVWQVGPLPGP